MFPNSTSTKTLLRTKSPLRPDGASAAKLPEAFADGWRVRALVRDPNKPAAQALAAQGAELVQGDLDDRASLESALQDAYGVFSVQTPSCSSGKECSAITSPCRWLSDSILNASLPLSERRVVVRGLPS